MKKILISTLITAFITVNSYSQGFVQGAFTTDVFTADGYDGSVSTFKGIELQLGVFANPDIAHAFTVSFVTGLKFRDELGLIAVPSGGEIKGSRIYSFSSFSLGYERKIVWIGEFDDKWNVYTTRRFALNFINTKMKYNDPAVAAQFGNNEYSRTGLGANLGLGIGAARKFNRSTYAFADLSTGVTFGEELAYIPVTLSLGIRKMF